MISAKIYGFYADFLLQTQKKRLISKSLTFFRKAIAKSARVW